MSRVVAALDACMRQTLDEDDEVTAENWPQILNDANGAYVGSDNILQAGDFIKVEDYPPNFNAQARAAFVRISNPTFDQVLQAGGIRLLSNLERALGTRGSTVDRASASTPILVIEALRSLLPKGLDGFPELSGRFAELLKQSAPPAVLQVHTLDATDFITSIQWGQEFARI